MKRISKSKIINNKAILMFWMLKITREEPKDSNPHSYKDFFFIVFIFFFSKNTKDKKNKNEIKTRIKKI